MMRGQTALSPSGPKTNAAPDVAEVKQPVDAAAEASRRAAGQGWSSARLARMRSAAPIPTRQCVDRSPGAIRRAGIGDRQDDQQARHGLDLRKIGAVRDGGGDGRRDESAGDEFQVCAPPRVPLCTVRRVESHGVAAYSDNAACTQPGRRRFVISAEPCGSVLPRSRPRVAERPCSPHRPRREHR